MNFTASALVLIFLLTYNGNKIRQQSPSMPPQDTAANIAELKKLEAQFEQIDRKVRPVEVKVTGDTEPTGRINVSVKSEVLGGPNSENANTGQPKIKKETLLDIDLSKINVPDEYISEKIAAAFSAPSSGGACPGVKVMQNGASRDYTVIEDYTYDSGAYKITAWKDFTYDRASIPRIFWVLIDKDSLSNVAPLFHDLLYRNGGTLPNNRVSPYRTFSRKQTDDLLYELMTKCGVKKWRRDAAYQAVRNFGGSSWIEHRPR